MEQSPSWEANRFSAIQEIPGILRNRKVHYHITSARNTSVSWARSIQTMPHIPLPEYPSQYYPPIYAWAFQVVSFSGFPTKTQYTPLLSPYALYTPPI
jgi:hypothetical protein